MKHLLTLFLLGSLAGCGGGSSGPELPTNYINDVITTSNTVLDYGSYGSNNYYFRSGLLADLDNDGKNEFVFSVSGYPQTHIPLTVLSSTGSLDSTSRYFPNGSPKVMHSPWIHYVDINGDNKKDIIASEAGFDIDPWTGSEIGVALKTGDSFTDISNLLPVNKSRSYAVAIGKFDNTSVTKVLLPAQESNVVAGTSMLMSFNDGIQTHPNPITDWVSHNLHKQTAMVTADFNKDGYDDLLVSGDWTGRSNVIVYGSSAGLDITTINPLPAGPFGQSGYDWFSSGQGTPNQILHSSEVHSISVDLNNDGKPDIFSVYTHTIWYPPKTITTTNTLNYKDIYDNGGLAFEDAAFTTLINNNGRTFTKTPQSSSNTLGYNFNFNLIPFDINSDGYMDIIGHYYSNREEKWGTTFFINDGTGTFNVIDGKDIFPQLLINNQLGAVIPVSVSGNNFEGIQLIRQGTTAKYVVRKFTTNQIKKLSSFKP